MSQIVKKQTQLTDCSLTHFRVGGVQVAEISYSKESQKEMDNIAPKFLSEESVQQIKDNSTLKKSDKFRTLYKNGVSVKEIAEMFGAHYSFVSAAVKRPEK